MRLTLLHKTPTASPAPEERKEFELDRLERVAEGIQYAVVPSLSKYTILSFVVPNVLSPVPGKLPGWGCGCARREGRGEGVWFTPTTEGMTYGLG